MVGQRLICVPVAALLLSAASCTRVNPLFGESESDGGTGTDSAGGTGMVVSGVDAATGDSATSPTLSTAGMSATSTASSPTTTPSATGEGTDSSSSGAETEDTPTLEPPCGVLPGKQGLIACYDFNGVGRQVLDSTGAHPMNEFVGVRTPGPAGWGEGINCEEPPCTARTDDFEMGDRFTLEVWVRLTRANLVEGENGPIFSIVPNDGGPTSVVAGSFGAPPGITARFMGTQEFPVFSESDTEYRCMAIVSSGLANADLIVRRSDGSTVERTVFAPAESPNTLGTVHLELGWPSGGAEPGLVPAVIIGARLWDEAYLDPCMDPLPPPG